MKNITYTLLLLGTLALAPVANADDHSPAAENETATEDRVAKDSSMAPENGASRQDSPVKKNESSKDDETAGGSEQESPDLAKDAAKRGTPPWTDDSANVNLQQPRTSPDAEEAEPYSPDDFTIKPEWEKIFADDKHFSTTSGEELYQTMCQACHMEDGQGASGAGDYPSFVGDKRLRSPFYAIDVILNGLRGMPDFKDQLSNEQIADVVNHLRTNFGNQLDGDATAEDVGRVRHE